MKRLLKLAMVLLAVAMPLTVFGQGSTTAGMNGRITDTDGSPLPGATVVAEHMPTTSQYGGITDSEGFFRLPNMNVGGPYKVTVSFVGFETFEVGNIYLSLGQTYRINTTLGEETVALEEIMVVGTRMPEYNMFDGNRTGAETVIGSEQIDFLPSIGRDLTDFTRLTPQANLTGGGISIAGINNRYNAISIDGAVNNDVFGLAASGTNGGQTGGTPISMDAIEQFQIVLAPYDVRQGGFAGASINAVTRSGSNQFEGSAYYFMRNEKLAGKTPTDDESIERTRLDEFSSATYGFRLGGPIIKNKLFFFLNAEIGREETPQQFNTTYGGDGTEADLDAIATHLINTFGYDPGPWKNKVRTLDSEKFLARLDYNLSRVHKLTLRHSYVNNEAIRANRSSSRTISYLNNSEYFPSVTNSTALELKSNWDKFSNQLTVGFTSVRDDRDPTGDPFPAFRIYDGSATIYLGSEAYSTANQLYQDVLTINDNFNLYLGKHTLTIGMNHEYSSTYNLFMRKNFGEYRYSTIADFMTIGTGGEVPAYQYERGYSLIDDITGDGSAAAADFRMLQIGFYVQDEFWVNSNLKITAGVRMDMPMFLDDPAVDDNFNSNTIPALEAAGWDMLGAEAGKMPKSNPMLSPRIGFNWDVNGDETMQVRGGVGLFASRLPLVWPGGSYTNNGTAIGGVFHRSSFGTDIFFEPDWENQYKAADFGGTDAAWGGQVDLFAADFKFPKVLRTSLALDHKLPWGMIGTLEGIFTKNLNNVNYYNVNIDPDPVETLDGVDDRPFYDASNLDGDYTRIMLGINTNEGYTYNLTAQLQKPFDNGFTASIAYTFGRALAVNDGTSSQNSSQWRYNEQVDGLNDLPLTFSDFDMGHRLSGFLSYRFEYLNSLATTVSFFYNGQSGDRYSYVYNDGGDLNGNGESENNLIYVPANASEIIFADGVTATQQWAELNDFIENDAYLSTVRGEYAERNGARLPTTHIVDLKIAQDIFTNIGGRRNTLQITLDIFNLTNLINKDWGRRYFMSNDQFWLIDFEGFVDEANGDYRPTYSFNAPDGDAWDISDAGFSSARWQAQFGIRYIF